ncbi:hypothetical protein CsSME_00033422 [Camellia sinensis var. sinensis]
MPSTTHLPILFLLLISATFTAAKRSFQPRALLLPVTKDPSSLQYLTQINQRTPLVPVKLTVDLGGQYLWVNCDQGYLSSSYRPVRCSTPLCTLSKSSACGDCFAAPKPGCNHNTCGLNPINTVGNRETPGEFAQDIISIQSTDGSNPGRVVIIPRLTFVCGSTWLLGGLASGVTGMAGLGRTDISLPSQFSSAFHFPRKFAICFSSSTTSTGVMFFGGNGTYVFQPYIDISKSLIYTPLIKNRRTTASPDYFIRVKSIKINGNNVPLNTSLLNFKKGRGGTKISTVNPYTVMETSIYNAITNAFIKELSNVPRVAAVSPFGVCFSSKSIGSTRVGPGVPQIDLVLQRESVYWRIFGANSMVSVSDSALCLGFVDGGVDMETSIVIGGYQLEDNLVEFDLAKSRLGFSSSLLFRQTTCGNFNFTANA